jgi:hypothetical protein
MRETEQKIVLLSKRGIWIYQVKVRLLMLSAAHIAKGLKLRLEPR